MNPGICLERSLDLRAKSKMFKSYQRFFFLFLVFSLKITAASKGPGRALTAVKTMFAPLGIWHPVGTKLKLNGGFGTRMDEGWGLTV